VIEPSVEIARKVARLSVLVEMFDEEVDSVMAKLEEDPRYETALLLRHAERLYYKFVAEPGESDLSIEVLGLVASSISEDERPDYPATLAAFVDARRDRIEDAFRDYGATSSYAEDYKYFLFSQPESLILWERIEHRPRALAHSIENTDLAGPVGVLAEVWGSPLSTE
jgi:putative GTP pyrophosphokinase